MLTPKDYLSRYRALEVFVFTDEQAKAAATGQLPPGGEWKTVDLHNYRLGLADNKGTAKDEFVRKVKPHIDKKGETISVWVKTVDGLVESRTYTNKSELFENAVDTFYGKGSPEEVQVTLQLAVRYGVIAKSNLQSYCDGGSIGLDCNGFVGNYLRHVKLGIPWHSDPSKKEASTQMHASQSINRILTSKIVTPVKSLSDVVSHPESIFILALCDERGFVSDRYKHPGKKDSYGHIVLTNPHSLKLVYWAVQPWYKITVLESTGDGVGLVESEYNFLEEMNKGIFKVFRGSKRGLRNDTMTVKIGRVI